MKGYQIICKGKYALFNSNTKIHSKYIYLTYPTQDIIDKFIISCTSPMNVEDLLWIDEKSVTTKVVEVEIIE